MPHGRQLRIFLADGTSSGPKLFEIFNRTIQALGLPANRLADAATEDWPEFQKPGVYLIRGNSEEGVQKMYIGKAENVAQRLQAHPGKLPLEIVSVLLFVGEDANLNGSQVAWLESSLIRAMRESKRISLANVQTPELPSLSKPEQATAVEFFEDLRLIAQTGGFDYFPTTGTDFPAPAQADTTPSPPVGQRVIFYLKQPQKDITAYAFRSDNGFVVRKNSEANAVPTPGFDSQYVELRENLIQQKVLIPKSDKPNKLIFAIDYAFTSPTPAASVIMGNRVSGLRHWRVSESQTLGEYEQALAAANAEKSVGEA